MEKQFLTEPSKELAEQVVRKVSWDERIEGQIYDPGPGQMVQRIYRLSEVHSLLKSIQNFSIDFMQLKGWIGETLGDLELANELDKIVSSRNEQREKVIGLLALRLTQCQKVLESA